MGSEEKNDGGSGSDTSRDAWLLDVAESRLTQLAAFDPKQPSGIPRSDGFPRSISVNRPFDS